MLKYVKGTLAMKLAESVVIETGGVGFEIFCPQNSKLYLINEGSEAIAYTYMSVREDDISLYGFDDEEGLMLFQKLITVNGIGSKAAMSILSAMSISDVKKAIIYEDADMLTRANGIGKKTAQRVVLELKDKIEDLDKTVDLAGDTVGAGSIDSSNKTEAIDALLALGYQRSEAATALAHADPELTTEEYIKQALKNI